MDKHPPFSHIQSPHTQGRVKDASYGHWVYRILPSFLWPYAQLARWDRPVGWKLLMWPCFWGLAMAMFSGGAPALSGQAIGYSLFYLFLFFVGSVAMRGAGCTWNDLVDHNIDAKVERTRSRPLPSGQVSRKQAKIFVILQALVGLAVLLCFNFFSILLGISSLIIVVIYPFMKRITDWPQFFLGLAFNWGALMGWAVWYGNLSWAAISLYAGAVLWTIGYDTIYAHQDKEDDALVGVRSTARLFHKNTKAALIALYSAFALLTALAFFLAAEPIWSYVGLILAVVHMFYQIWVLNIDNSEQCLKLFKSNSLVGFLVFLGLYAGGLISLL